MALLDLWNKSVDQLRGKQFQQLIAFAGEGKLTDGSACSQELREFLASVSSENLIRYADECLTHSFPDSGMALQDVVNEVGSRIGAEVTPGRYRGTKSDIGYDGLWKFSGDQSIIVEVKTTDTFRIDLNVIADYRTELINGEVISESSSSMLLIVGREDTGDLEAQIRGSRYAWDLRIISVDALVRLMAIKEEVEDPQIIQRIHSILVPREFTRLDEIADVLFSATEDIKQDVVTLDGEATDGGKDTESRESPVDFHDACIALVEKFLKIRLIRRTRVQYSNPEKTIMVNCKVSKEYDPETNPNYWYSFYQHQKEVLENSPTAHVAFGCGSSKRVLLIPYREFRNWISAMWTTSDESRHFWHVVIHRQDGSYILHRRKGEKNIDVTSYLIPEQRV